MWAGWEGCSVEGTSKRGGRSLAGSRVRAEDAQLKTISSEGEDVMSHIVSYIGERRHSLFPIYVEGGPSSFSLGLSSSIIYTFMFSCGLTNHG